MSAIVTAAAIVTVRSTIVRLTGSLTSSWKLLRLNWRTTAEVIGLRYQKALSSRIASDPR